MLEGHGDDSYRYGGMIKADFSSNIYAGFDLSELKQHLSERLSLIEHYPEPESLTLERLMADKNAVKPDNVIATNGATGAIYLLARSLAKDSDGQPFRHVIKQPTFSEYADACRSCGIVPHADNDVSPMRKVHWLCNPNNPTGSIVHGVDIIEQALFTPEDIFIIDQSYANYCLEHLFYATTAAGLPNIIIIRSFSKDYGVPGLRLGCIFGSKKWISHIRRFRQPWSVGAIDIEAGMFLLRSYGAMWHPRRGLLAEAQRLRRELGAISGLTVFDTNTNFMLCRLERSSAAWLKRYLAERHGLLIRDASNFSGLDSRYFRVAAQTKEADNALVAAIKEYVGGQEG